MGDNYRKSGVSHSGGAPCVKCGCGRKLVARWLCKSCYNHLTPLQKKAYPVKYASAGNERQREIRDISEADLDKMIAEQMACLPEWWHEDTGASDKAIARMGRVRWELPVLYLRGGRVMRKLGGRSSSH